MKLSILTAYVYHRMAVRAYDGQIFELRADGPAGLGKGTEVMYLRVTFAERAVALSKVKCAPWYFTDKPTSRVAGPGSIDLDLAKTPFALAVSDQPTADFPLEGAEIFVNPR